MERGLGEFSCKLFTNRFTAREYSCPQSLFSNSPPPTSAQLRDCFHLITQTRFFMELSTPLIQAFPSLAFIVSPQWECTHCVSMAQRLSGFLTSNTASQPSLSIYGTASSQCTRWNAHTGQIDHEWPNAGGGEEKLPLIYMLFWFPDSCPISLQICFVLSPVNCVFWVVLVSSSLPPFLCSAFQSPLVCWFQVRDINGGDEPKWYMWKCRNETSCITIIY
jgi:hypothetical protein